jgi:hypothetical protein
MARINSKAVWPGCAVAPPAGSAVLSHRDAPFQQEGSDLIDDASALAHQPLTEAMQSLQVELIGGLGDHKLHRRSLYCPGNRLGVTEVVLLAFGIGSHYMSALGESGHDAQ